MYSFTTRPLAFTCRVRVQIPIVALLKHRLHRMAAYGEIPLAQHGMLLKFVSFQPLLRSCFTMDPEFRAHCNELLKRIVHLRDCL